MGLNCRPKQWAWIDVPRTPRNLRFGLDKLHGHVVRTEQLLAAVDEDGPAWEVSPEQRVQAVFKAITPLGTLRLEEWRVCLGIPDAWLRPLDDFAPEEIEELHRELTSP